MKKQILMLSTMALFMVTSCSKSTEEPKEETVSCQLTQASVTGYGETITHNYEYNNGQMTNVKYASNVSTSGNYSYNYTTTSISSEEISYTLDAQGRVKTEAGLDYNGGNTKSSYTKSYIYNNEGYLTEIKNDKTNDVIKYTWANGNLTKIEETTNNGGNPFTYTEVYEYSTDVRPANFHSDVPDLPVVYTYMFKYMGKQAKNLISKIRYERGSTEIFSYGIDANGNVTSLTEKEEASGKVWSTYEFKYNCK